MQFSSIVFDLTNASPLFLCEAEGDKERRFPNRRRTTWGNGARGILSVADKSLRRDIFAPLPGV
jgi:hypothetical protein